MEGEVSMRISLIGAGRVATHLAKTLLKQHDIVDICARQQIHAETLAVQVGARAVDQYIELNADIDLLIIAVPDQMIAQVANDIGQIMPDVFVVHTSGSTDLAVLTEFLPRAGVFYPLQTFSLEREIDWSNTPLFIEAVQPYDLATLQRLAEALSQRVYAYTSAQRLSLHLAAVFACNFTNACYDMAKQVVDAQQVDFSLLAPLILETAKKATEHDPKSVQTGPAARGDDNILQMHEKMLKQGGKVHLVQIYHQLSHYIMQRQKA